MEVLSIISPLGWRKKQRSPNIFLFRFLMSVFTPSNPFSVQLILPSPEHSVVKTSLFSMVFLQLSLFSVSFLTIPWTPKIRCHFLSNMSYIVLPTFFLKFIYCYFKIVGRGVVKINVCSQSAMLHLMYTYVTGIVMLYTKAIISTLGSISKMVKGTSSICLHMLCLHNPKCSSKQLASK